MAQSPLEAVSPTTISSYLKSWDALSSMIVRGRSFSGYERNCAFLNTGKGFFADISATSGFDLDDDARAIGVSDWDGDGDLDFWITNRNAPRVRFLRNNFPQSRAVTISLEGTNCNRDAIGAIVELTAGEQKYTRVLRAGDSFMSQSSKQLHFGLATTNQEIVSTSAKVRWPDGAIESFAGITVGGRFKLLQGSGTPSPTPPANAISLRAGEITPAPQTESARVVLTDRPLAEPIDYVDFKGNLQHIGPRTVAGSPVLINLWASWCIPCVAELSDFSEHHEQFRSKGLKIFALTTEAVTADGSPPDMQKAISLAEDSAYPFNIGATDANGLRILTLLHNQRFVRERPLPLPTSFLIDKHGRLAVIYRGPVTTEQLLADIDLLDAAPAVIEEAAFPFPSSNGLDLFRIGDLDFAQAYQAGGYVDDARRAARKAIDTAGAKSNASESARSWYYLGTLEQSARNWTEAAAAYKRAIEFAPSQPLLKIPLGVVLWQSGERESATRAFAEAAGAGKDNVQLMDALGKAHLQIDAAAEAVVYFEKAMALAPEGPRYALAHALAVDKTGDAQGAVDRYEAILKNHPDSADAKNNLAWILSTCHEDDVRDGERALELATEINRSSKFGNPLSLDTLAAAQAETGDFSAAVSTIEKAKRIAKAEGKMGIVRNLDKKLSLYREGKPHRREDT